MPDRRDQNYSISDLRDRPEFASTVAERVWNAWWRDQGVGLDHLQGLVDESLTPAGRPMALVAHDGDTFLGTAHLIDDDLEARPQYAPWVAAVWVDEAARKAGIGSALVRAAAETAFGQGFETVYLCAEPAKAGFYEGLGWRRIERDVDGLDVFSLSKPS
ncbi:GNAT family N-acetyltransferase [Mesorhizobium sp. CC13]|uniref:GNAT family N-acetyltransferase n=1 Tax=Mesorhizobium sp. CC13 TaxID=3029194 RepID=UPI0032649A18